ncbi:MAG: CBS domain-containing protein [Peptococcaceae bacterium]|nr:CBS domain-containing protein [Peptococcaceae bacterium]
MAVLVRDVMIKNPITLNEKATIGQAVEVFAEKKVGCLPLVDDNGRLTAFLSDGDIVDYVVRNVRRRNNQYYNIRAWYQVDCFGSYLKACVNDGAYGAASHNVITVESTDTVRSVSQLIQKKHLKHVPVLDEGKFVGIITRNDIINGLFKDYLANPDAECVEGSQDDDF